MISRRKRNFIRVFSWSGDLEMEAYMFPLLFRDDTKALTPCGIHHVWAE